MALALYDRVQQTGTANTTVSFTLSGSVTGYQSFSVVGNGNTTYYGATDTSGNWEVGIGTYVTGGTLTRTTILSSSNSGSAVTFSGTVTVFVTYPSERSVNLDGSGNVSALGTVSSGTWNGSTIPVAYGGTGVTSSSGANSVMLRDANQNVSINRLNQSSTTTNAAGTTTTLTAASTFSQVLSGTGGQTFKLPDATTLTNTTTFEFNNNATGTLTIVDNASGAVGTITSGGAAAIALLSNGTVAGTWDVHAYIPVNVQWGTNSLALGSTVITGGTWNGGTIASGYGGTGLTTFTGANNALYSTSSSALAAGTLPVAAGGTGLTTGTANGIFYGNGTSAHGVTAAGTTGQVLIATTSGAPSWGSVPTTAAVTSFSAGTTGFTPNSATTGVVTLAGTLGVTNGGTGITTAPTAGSVVYGATSSTQGYTAAGTSGQVLISGATGSPTWTTNIAGSAANVTGTVAIANGGTGQTTAAAAFNALNPMTTTGDIVYEASASTAARLAIGTSGQVLTVAGGIPSWQAAGGSTTLTTTDFTATSGQTSFTVTYTPALLQGVYRNGIKLGQADYTSTSGTAIVLATGAITGDLIQVQYFSSLATTTAVNSISFGSTGLTPSTATSGVVSVAGTLGVGYGGTGLTAGTSGGIPYFSSTSAITSSAALTQYGVVYGGGAGAAPVSTAAGTTGQILTATTGGAPTWASPAASGATITGTTTSATYYVVGTTLTSGTLSTASISNTNAVSYNANTGALTAVSMVSSSDERLKTNWAGLDTDFVSRLANVKHGTFERISSGNREVGVTAQSLKDVLPEAVIESDEGLLGVNYGGAALVAAIELAKEVKELRAEIKALKAELNK
jgi:hypothetical protein